MNYIQRYFNLRLVIVQRENKAAYIQALIDTREQENIEIFRAFMAHEYAFLLTREIEKFEEMKKPSKGPGFTFFFSFPSHISAFLIIAANNGASGFHGHPVSRQIIAFF